MVSGERREKQNHQLKLHVTSIGLKSYPKVLELKRNSNKGNKGIVENEKIWRLSMKNRVNLIVYNSSPTFLFFDNLGFSFKDKYIAS